MARISAARLEDTHFEVAKDFDVRKLLKHTFGRFVIAEKAKTVRLLFDKETAPWVLERQWHPSQQVKQRKDRSIELTMEVAGLFEVSRWVLAWGRHVKVLAPPEFVARVRDEVHGMADRYEETDKRGGNRP
jgi:predicted DNA-binding transcriptional regulator YafY